MTQAAATAALSDREEVLLKQVTRLNTYVFASTFGLLGASALAAGTVVQLVRDDAGFGIGVLIGALWGLLYGAVIGALVYRGYARTLRARLAHAAQTADRRKTFRVSVLRLHGTGLGLVVGLMVALQLLLMTNWLVAGGTASESVDAMLLAQYLPGYSVSPLGSIIGAVQLFAVAYLAALALAGIYNQIVDWRQSQHPRRR